MAKTKRNRRTGRFEKTKAKSDPGIEINRVTVAPAEGAGAYAANVASLAQLSKAMQKAGIPVFETVPMSFDDAQKALKKHAAKNEARRNKATRSDKKSQSNDG